MEMNSIANWREADGDNTYALDWPLTENSHVWEIGGFEGRWAQQIWDKFHCHITIFEPQLWAVERMQKRFAGIGKIDIRPYGLSLDDGVMNIGNYHTDGASLINDDFRELTQLGVFKGFYHEVYNFPHNIDLALMNIEGYEYILLPDFIASGIISRFHYFWCQFHPGLISDEPSEQFEATNQIFDQMEDTHKLMWSFFPTAVAWRRK